VQLKIHVDGGARGNPGPAGAGVVINTASGAPVHEGAYFLGRQTNNAAEYHALIRALQRATRAPQADLAIFSDSELLVRQITGRYRVKSPKLAELFEQAQVLLLRAARWRIEHIRREQNVRADELANLAMDQGHDQILFDLDDSACDSDTSGTGSCPSTSPAAPSDATCEAADDAGAAPTVHVVTTRRPGAGSCPCGDAHHTPFTCSTTLPGGVCLHAAHALLPTILAVQNTDRAEFSQVPALMVRCARSGCGATFEVSPDTD